MGLFSSDPTYIGVDIGTSSIKVVELANYKGRPRLVTYGFTEKNVADSGGTPSADDLALAINEICAKSHITGKKAITALPSFSVFTSILNLPYLSKKELSSAVTWEAKKIIPMPLEDIILDWKVIAEIEAAAEGEAQAVSPQAAMPFRRILSKPKKNIRVLLTGASKSLVKKYISIFEKAGITLLSLETESFALIRSLTGNDPATVAIIDMGATTSSITVVDRGIPVLTRSLEVGGLMMTRAIATSLNVNLERAEQFKQDLTLDMETAENSLPQTVEKSFASILNEIRYTINLYQDQNKKQITKIILTGGSSLLGHLPGYLESQLNITTHVGDPWARVMYPTDLKPVLDRLGARFAVAIGLAMRNIS